MKAKIIAIIGGFATLMVTNGAIYGGLLADHFNEIVSANPDIMHQSMAFVMMAHFLQTLLLVWLFPRLGVDSASEGFKTSALLHFLMIGTFNCFILATFTLFSPMQMCVDVGINMLTGGAGGAAVAVLLSKFSDA